MKRKTSIILLIVPLTITFAILGYIGLYTSEYLSVSDLLKYEEPTKVTVLGNVTKGSVRFVEGNIEFLLTDGLHYVKVIYPSFVQLDNSTNYAQVTVIGIYYPDKNIIEAEEILFKCPSKEQMEVRNQTSVGASS
jgi:cytochrome c-type biogenesis protein CcmE